jgi:hypothetical protein
MDNETFDMMWQLSESESAFERCFLRIPQTESYTEPWTGRHELEHLPDVCTVSSLKSSAPTYTLSFVGWRKRSFLKAQYAALSSRPSRSIRRYTSAGSARASLLLGVPLSGARCSMCRSSLKAVFACSILYPRYFISSVGLLRRLI